VSHDHKHHEEMDLAKAAADAEESKANVTEADVKSVDEKLLSFVSGLHAGERKHIFNMLDKHSGGDKNADVQGYWWHNSWRVRWWGTPWGSRWRRW